MERFSMAKLKPGLGGAIATPEHVAVAFTPGCVTYFRDNNFDVAIMYVVAVVDI
jgi:hypothetical protein